MRTISGLIAAVILTGCAGTPLMREELPANRYEVPEEAPNSNVIPAYGGELKSEAEREQAIRELEEEAKTHKVRAESAIKKRS